eukprot:snap_masked-scaffold_6-processed-gene-20.35-mRNA-1 protein AED:1.00 eAED:1.00 QI:0/0/0/0/1/1/2/0/78
MMGICLYDLFQETIMSQVEVSFVSRLKILKIFHSSFHVEAVQLTISLRIHILILDIVLALSPFKTFAIPPSIQGEYLD